MTRREFIPSASLFTAAMAGIGAASLAQSQQKFSMHYAPHFGMFQNSAGEDLVDQIAFAADHGFTAWEDNGMKNRSISTQQRIATSMVKHNMRMGVFVAHTIYWNEPSLATGNTDFRNKFLDEIKDSVEVAKRVNATWMTVVPGFVDLRTDMGFQTANVIETLRRASDILEPHGLVMVLEPLNPFNHPGMFLSKIPQAYEICRAVNSPSCKILNDLYHQQITEGNLIPNIDGAWSEIAYYQIGDNPGRKEPTTGEINFTNVFAHVRDKGFEGILGMEHGNRYPGADGEMALIQAYQTVDGQGG
ncbi:MAG: TIM barrel protein [Bacteroidetes bacterium]|nr:TIM barrel protein [Bacteroidota bacterium]